MKASVGLDTTRYVSLDRVTELTANSKDMTFAQHVADSAITLVRSDGQTLPLRDFPGGSLTGGAKRTVVVMLAETFEAANGRELEKSLKLRRPDARIFYVDNRTATAGGIEVLRSIGDADEVVVAAFLFHQGARRSFVDGATATVYGLNGPSGQFLQKVLSIFPRTVVVALGSPYLIENFPQIQNYICTYAMNGSSEASVGEALFGGIQNTAKLPITLPGVAPRGFFIAWPPAPQIESAK